jgi:hypothetical protein
MNAMDDFIAEMRADPTFAPGAGQLEAAFRNLDVEGDTNPNAAGLVAVIEYVCRAPGSLLHRLRLLDELVAYEGRVRIPRALLADRTHPKHGVVV